MQRLSAQYFRCGSRRIRVFLKQRHRDWQGQTQPGWVKHGLQMLKKRPLASAAISSVRNYGFIPDACANGQRLKCLTVVDEYTREALVFDVAGLIQSGRLIEVLSKFISVCGGSRYLCSDNGPEFVSAALPEWVA